MEKLTTQQLMAKIPHPDRQEDIRKRLETIILDRFNGRQGELAQAASIQPAALSKIMNGKADISVKQLRSIESASRARFEWLTTGQDPVYHPAGWRPVAVQSKREGDYFRLFVLRHKSLFTQKELADQIPVAKSTITDYFTTGVFEPSTRQLLLKALRTLLADPTLSEEEVFGPASPAISSPSAGPAISPELRLYLEDDQEYMDIPTLSEHARAGLDIERYFEQPDEITRVWKSQIPQNLRKRKWWEITVNGDSMEPRLKSGDKVLAYWLDRDEWDKFHNRVAIIQYAGHVVIKRVKNNRLQADAGLYLHSDSPDAETFFVPIEDLQHIFLVKKIYGDI